MQGKRQPLSEAERDSLKKLSRYAIAIFTAVSLTLIVVALASSLLAGGAA